VQEEIEILNIPHTTEAEADQEVVAELQQRQQLSKDQSFLPTPEPSDRDTVPPQEWTDDDRDDDGDTDRASEPAEQISVEDQQSAEDQDTEEQIQDQLLDELQTHHEDERSTATSNTDGPLRPPATSKRGRPRKQPSTWAKGWSSTDDYVPDRHQNNALKMADLSIWSSNIIAGKRTRKPPD